MLIVLWYVAFLHVIHFTYANLSVRNPWVCIILKKLSHVLKQIWELQIASCVLLSLVKNFNLMLNLPKGTKY